MRIMSFNLLCDGRWNRQWQRRVPRAVAAIQACNPDSFGVQEAHLGWMTALQTHLPEYDYVGVGREDGAQEGEFSAVFYRRDRFTLLDSGTFWLSETPETPSMGWDADYRRVCTWAKLQEKATGKVFAHFNTHLDHVGRVAQQKGAELVSLRAEALGGDIPAVFTGDFNVTPDSAPCQAIKARGFVDLRDTAAETDRGDTFHDFTPDKPGLVIDYVFARGDVTAARFCVMRDMFDGDYPSDHYPVYADVGL